MIYHIKNTPKEFKIEGDYQGSILHFVFYYRLFFFYLIYNNLFLDFQIPCPSLLQPPQP